MSSCQDVEPLITASVDGEATDADRAVVAGHLDECARCRRRASQETSARRILRERAQALKADASPALRAKVGRSLSPAVTTDFTVRRTWFRPLPVWATAGVVVGVFAAVFYVSSRGSTLFAAGLTLDHLKCFALFESASGPGDPTVVANRLKTSYGWTIAVPGSSRALGLRLVGGRRCLSTDGGVAHILYRHDGRPLSLFVLSGASRAAQRLGVMGHEAVIWSQGGKTYVVLARESRDEVAQVAAYVRSVTE
jgi:anti-sigma factor RsiW